jgi:hypothetical protein
MFFFIKLIYVLLFAGYKMPIDDMKNKTMITCIVPLLRDFGHTDQLESGIVVTWIKSCDHVVFLRNRTLSRLDKGIQHSLKTLQYRARSKMKTSVSYFYIPENMTETADNNSVIVGDVTKTDDNTSEDMSWLMSQFKAIEFAFHKYSDTNIFIVTPSVKDIIKYFYKHVNGHSDDKQLERLQNFLRTDVSFELAVLQLDECLVLGRKAVSKLIKMTNLKLCSFKNQRVLFEWAEQCIGS